MYTILKSLSVALVLALPILVKSDGVFLCEYSNQEISCFVPENLLSSSSVELVSGCNKTVLSCVENLPPCPEPVSVTVTEQSPPLTITVSVDSPPIVITEVVTETATETETITDVIPCTTTVDRDIEFTFPPDVVVTPVPTSDRDIEFTFPPEVVVTTTVDVPVPTYVY